MNIKTFSVSILAIALPFLGTAQDKIYKRGGDVIDCKIKSVNIKTITYVRYDNQSGPEYTLIKGEVSKIVYQNGTTDEFRGRRMPFRRPGKDGSAAGGEAAEVNYSANLLALAPIQFSENGIGAGLSYERVLDKNGIVAFYLPLIMTLNLNSHTYYNSATGTYMNGHQDMMFYTMPGIKIYPTGAYGVVRYGVGPSLAVGMGEKSQQVYDPVFGTQSYVTNDHVILGMVLNNSLNINPSEHLYMGVELGIGFTYLNRVNGLNQNSNGLVQGSFKIGYRF